ncbi:SusE domain-containing protein [Pontibacter akesuensis]|uniref:SusE outer membrane protein n=1 Tax=Pontibacter akesuensis TaxID=388950 RepID=A0A1I7GSC1_9BACT|nr:SusE domain-containing protein [Pontibacter akesuensis]GHA55307.1 hypothetical protein GCM10007389_03450 [Pontibacter akesuensis]SFU51363.1 SusE outer membrane protein [Pontibacter akesuensis]
MKNWLNKTFIFFVASLALMSCEKDEDMAILKTGEAPVLSASTNTLVLTEEEAANEAVTLTWGEADFGYNAAVKYSLQIDTAGDNFVKPYSMDLGSFSQESGNQPKKVFTVEELNTLLTKLKYTAEEAHELKIRIKATVSDLVEPIYSNAATINVTPYSTYVEPSYVFVPGAHQGWSPETAPALASVESNGIYMGIVSFMDASGLEFKITPQRNWDMDYGMGAAPGTLAEKGGNLSVPAPDTYMITANLNNMTWSAAKHSWGLIGDATPGGWDNDTNMKYINSEGVWKLTTTLKAGKIKFRFNDAWELNYGDDDTSNNLLNQGGADINITSPGTYDIVLDLENDDDSVTYSVTKK